jgi:alcohol dehydrogenase
MALRAIVLDDELRFDPSYPDPKPEDGDCLVRVIRAGVCATDLAITRGYMNYQGVLGHEFVGVVEQGPKAWVGKRVVADINVVCRRCDMCLAGLSPHCRRRTVLGIDGRGGCFADLIAVPERNLYGIPDSVSDAAATFVEPVAAACQVLAQASIEPRMKVTVVGAGRLGLLVAQLLKETGCKLDVVGRRPERLLFCEKKGIQGVLLDDLVPKQDRDVVVECSGVPDGLKVAMELVRPRGSIMLKSTYADQDAAATPLNLAPIVVHEISLIGSRCGPFPEAINALARQAIDVETMISQTLPIEQGVEALAAAAKPENLKVHLAINAR